MSQLPSLLERIRLAPRKVGYDVGPRLMSWLRKRWVLIRHPHATIVFQGPAYLGPGFSLDIPDRGTFVVGPNAEFRRNFRAEIAGEGRITIGEGCVFTYSVLIQCSTSVDIGDRCVFAQASAIFDGNHRFRDLTMPMLDQGFEFTPIRIENDVLVTSKCTVLADIGERACIGANSVVTRPIPAFTVAVGAPARPIDYFGPPGNGPSELGPSPAPKSKS